MNSQIKTLYLTFLTTPQTVQVLLFPISPMFCTFHLVTWLVFRVVLAIPALLCSQSPTVRFRLLSFPSCPQKDDSQNKIRTLPALSTQERVYLSMEKCPPPSSSSRDPSQLGPKKRSLQWHTSLLMDDLCGCRHSKFWQVPSYSQSWAINLAV